MPRITAAAASACPRCSSIIAPHQICPIGLAIALPAMSGAEPCTGSNSDGYSRSGLMLAEGAMPIVPAQAGPRSERMSPKRLEATTTSNQSGCRSEERRVGKEGRSWGSEGADKEEEWVG